MKPGEYLKDRVTELLFAAAALGVMLLFLYAFHVSWILTALIAGTFVAFGAGCLVWDFVRKCRFYNRLTNRLNAMDQRYLASAVIEKPDFCEGVILYDTICAMGKSMTEQVYFSRQNVTDFKEYVEMWVHEAKLPIASLLLKQHNMYPGSEEDAETMRQIRKQLLKLDSYTDQILYYTRSEVAEKDYLIKECLLSKAFSGTASRMREELQEYGFTITTQDLNVSVLTDGKWLEFILNQLISNSIKYRSKDREPQLKVWAEQQPDRVDLHLRDNGIGIPEADLSRIFEKSFTGENGRLREKSTGMGLYIARKLCDKMGHRISVSSVQGEYTEFTISFARNDFYKPV